MRKKHIGNNLQKNNEKKKIRTFERISLIIRKLKITSRIRRDEREKLKKSKREITCRKIIKREK